MMSSRSTTANLLKPKTVKQLQAAKKPSTANSLYSGILSAERNIQQQRYFGSASLWRSTQSKRGFERTSAIVTKTCEPPLNYHPWQSEYSKIITRDKKVKPMTKDPYTPISRLISYAVENATTEMECCSPLIPAKAVKIQTCKIQQTPRPSLPTVIRYLRRGELMPSERPASTPKSMKIPLLSQSEDKKSIISVSNVSKITGVAPTLATTNRLLNRVKIRTDQPVIRRPPRKLNMNTSRQTIMPLSVYG